MQELFTPHVGLMVWTVVTFLILVFILGRFGWGPLIRALDEREAFLRGEREAAERARGQAQKIQADLEKELQGIDARAQEVLARAKSDMAALKSKSEEEAREEAKRLMEKTRAELEEERRRLVAQLRQEVAGLAVSAAEKMIQKSIDEQVKKSQLEEFFKDLDKTGGRAR